MPKYTLKIEIEFEAEDYAGAYQVAAAALQDINAVGKLKVADIRESDDKKQNLGGPVCRCAGRGIPGFDVIGNVTRSSVPDIMNEE